jgi:hypothetical protein
MFDKLGGLQKYWYVIGNSNELKIRVNSSKTKL